jgi:hypothetical protein
MQETEETMILITLDELERELIKTFLRDWKDKVVLDELTSSQIDGLDSAIKGILKKIGED